jgi:hypothetical protein
MRLAHIYIILLSMTQYKLEINEHSLYDHLFDQEPPLAIFLDYKSYYKCKSKQGEGSIK